MSDNIPDVDRLTPEQWAKELFEFEYCGECGGDAEDHDILQNGLGGYFAKCRHPLPGDLSSVQIGRWLHRRMANKDAGRRLLA